MTVHIRVFLAATMAFGAIGAPTMAATVYWSLFNIEGETAQGARYVTYSSLADMLNDENRSGVFIPDGGSVPENVIGSGAFWVSDTTAVPIPASILFLFTGLGVLSTVRRKL